MDLNSILIGSEHPEALVAYYEKLFGTPTFSDGSYTGWVIGSGSVFIGAHDEVKGRNAHPGRIILNIECADVPTEFARMKAAGANVVREPYHPGTEDQGWIATLADPDDNYFQLMSPMGA